MNMNTSRRERATDALCGVAFVAFLIPFFAYVTVCYGIHRVSLRILSGFKHLRPASRTPIDGCPSHPHIATGDAIAGH
jgi:hypothetical protein